MITSLDRMIVVNDLTNSDPQIFADGYTFAKRVYGEELAFLLLIVCQQARTNEERREGILALIP